MTTLTYTHIRNNYFSHIFSYYNKYALLSTICVLLFISYFLIPHHGILSSVLQFDLLFIMFIPFAALILSVIGLRQITRTHDRGMIMSYITLGIMGFYFIVALAIPMVLLGLYILYTYLV